MEESPTAIETKRLVIEARQVLRQAYLPGACGYTPVEHALMTALKKLMSAVERSVQSGPSLPVSYVPELEELEELTTEGKGDPDLAELYASIMSRVEPTGNASQSKFVISFPDVELSIDEIWPDGDAPEDPTPEDVIEVMRETEYAHPSTVVTEWLLLDSLFVRRPGDTYADTEVEWDGT